MRGKCLAVVAAGLVAAAACCGTGRTAPVPPRLPPGCDPPTLLAKATITLSAGAKGCTASVAPLRVCVQRGGVVRWFVDNRCDALQGRDAGPALKVARVTPRERGRAGWFDKACSASLSRVERGSPLREAKVKAPPESNVILCSIPDDQSLEGQYKYDLVGEIVPVDPHLEVIPPSGPP